MYPTTEHIIRQLLLLQLLLVFLKIFQQCNVDNKVSLICTNCAPLSVSAVPLEQARSSSLPAPLGLHIPAARLNFSPAPASAGSSHASALKW